MSEPEGSFLYYQTTMTRRAKAIVVTAQEMVAKSNTGPKDLGPLANQLTSDYG
jgi:talin